MADRRGRELPPEPAPVNGDRPPRALVELTSGPGRLAAAFGLDRGHTGHDLSRPPLYIAPGRRTGDHRVARAPRVGVDYAGEDAWLDYRFFVEGDPFVSRPWPEAHRQAVQARRTAKR